MADPLKPGDPGYIAPTSGLLQTATPDKSAIGYTPTTAVAEKPTAVGYTPKGFDVSANQTVKGQIRDIIAEDSPLIQQAEARSRAAMNAKGLLNSSIAVGAGQAAVIDKALPIAQQDAKTYETANTNTVNAQNAEAAFKAGADNAASTRGAELGTNVALANADAANVAGRTAAENANQLLTTKLTTENQMAMAQLDANTKTALSTLDNQYRQLLQLNQGAQSMFNQITTNLANIALNPNLSKAAKDAATKTQINTLNEMLRMQNDVAAQDAATISEMDLSQYFKPATTPAPSTGGSTGAPTGGTTGTPATGGGGTPADTTDKDKLIKSLEDQIAALKRNQVNNSGMRPY